MTSVALILWILLVLLLQAFTFAVIAWRRHGNTTGNAPSAIPGMMSAPASEPQGWAGFRDLRVSDKRIENAGGDICSFRLEAVDGHSLPVFRPGQFLTFRVPVDGVECAPVVRCYSLSDAPGESSYRVSIKRLPEGRCSRYFHDQVAVGSVLAVRAPSGGFFLDEGDSPVVLIAGGIGITPLLSMALWAAKYQPGREVWLFYGVRQGAELAGRAQLDALVRQNPAFHWHTCFSQPHPGDITEPGREHEGRVSLELLRLHLPLKPFHYYLCGPASMLETLVPGLAAWGVPARNIHFEAFGPSSLAQPGTVSTTPRADARVRFVQSGKEATWHAGAGSLLDLAEAAGVSVESGCRAGSCGSCQTRLIEGEVVYPHPPDADIAPGHCLLCVAVPTAPLSLAL